MNQRDADFCNSLFRHISKAIAWNMTYPKSGANGCGEYQFGRVWTDDDPQTVLCQVRIHPREPKAELVQMWSQGELPRSTDDQDMSDTLTYHLDNPRAIPDLISDLKEMVAKQVRH